MRLSIKIVVASDFGTFIGICGGRYYTMRLDEDEEVELGDQLTSDAIHVRDLDSSVDFRNARTGRDVFIGVEESPSLEHAVAWIFGAARGKPFRLEVGSLDLPDAMPRPLGEDPSQN